MVKLVNRAKMTTTTVGTGTVTLVAAVAKHQSFASAGVVDSDQVRYAIEDGDLWEIGLGTYSSIGPTLSRGATESSSAGSEITLTGSAVVYVTAAETDIVQPEKVQTLVNKTYTDAEFTGSIAEQVFALTGTTPTLDPSNGTVQTHTLSGATTYTDSFANGETITLMVDDGAGATVTWPTTTWVNNGGVAPTLATTGYTVIALWKVGTTLYGALVGDGS
jgi:hypothetical protein